LVDATYTLYDEVEMKKEHPCSFQPFVSSRSSGWAPTSKSAASAVEIILMDRDAFNEKMKRVIAHHEPVSSKSKGTNEKNPL
jgi:hypothetical protein